MEAPDLERRLAAIVAADVVCATEDPLLFRAYLEKYPDREFAVIARPRLNTLRRAN